MKRQLMTRKFLNDDREYVLYGSAPTRAIAIAVKVACEDNGCTAAALTRDRRHYYIWVEKWWLRDIDNAIFVPDMTGSVPC